MQPPRATLVMTARERHSLAEAAIDSVLRATRPPIRLLYLDVQTPPRLRERLAARAAAGQIEIVRFDEPLWPQEARLRVVDAIDTDYAVFLDNDVEVAPGWLDALVRCADETGAGIVGPLYLIGGGGRAPAVHMAGGMLMATAGPAGRVLEEAHRLQHAAPDAAAALARTPCDYVEFHCMMIRASLLRGECVLDARLRCVHEHIDTSLAAKARGFATVFEPAASVTYLGYTDYTLDDLPLFRTRWTPAETDANIAVFCRKWNVVDDPRAFAGVRAFVRGHATEVDPLRATCAAPRDAPMPAAAHVQTRSALLDAAARGGYRGDECALIASAYHVAHVLMDGGYRPCGRPFINHLVGAASVLVHYGVRATTVAAALLHAAYTHSPAHAGGPAAALAWVRDALGGRGHAIESRVRAYTLAGGRGNPAAPADSDAGALAVLDSEAGALAVLDAEVAIIAAANELDLHASGEFRYSGRGDAIGDGAVARIGHVCRLLGIPGLHASLAAARAEGATALPALATNVRGSYRIGADRVSAVPMVVNDLSPLSAPGF